MKTLTQTILKQTATAVITAALCLFGPLTAKAELKPIFDKLDLYNTISTQPVIEVEAEDKSWTKVKTDVLEVRTSYYVSLKKGNLITISAIFANFPLAKNRHIDGKWRKGTFFFEITNGQMGVLKDHAVNACNNLKKNGARTDKTHNAFVPLPFNLFVRAERVGNQATKTVPGKLSAKVVCKAAPKIVEISHFNVKYDKNTGKCPIKGVVEVGFRTNRADDIPFILGHMNRGLKSTDYVAKPFMINGQYVATKRIDITLDSNTEYVQVKMENGDGFKRWNATGNQKIKCPEMKVLSVWMNHKVLKPGFCPGKFERTITVTTNAPGKIRYEVVSAQGVVAYSGEAGGGQAILEGNKYVYRSKSAATYNEPLDLELMAKIEGTNANSGWMKLKTDCVGTKKINIAYLDVKTPQCARTAKVIAQVEATTAGPIAYQLDCASAVKKWSFEGIAEAKAQQGKFWAGLGHDLDITKTQLVACVLKRKTINGLKVLALQGHKFQCVRKNPDIGQVPDGLKGETPTTHSKEEPLALKDPAPKKPICKTVWKKSCHKTPVKTCTNTMSKNCKIVPEKTCTLKKTQKCIRTPKRVCKEVRGNKICKTIWEKKCALVNEKVCKTTRVKKCTPKVVKKCTTQLKETCKPEARKICTR